MSGYRCESIAICIYKKSDGVKQKETETETVINTIYKTVKKYLLEVVKAQEGPGEDVSDDKETNFS